VREHREASPAERVQDAHAHERGQKCHAEEQRHGLQRLKRATAARLLPLADARDRLDHQRHARARQLGHDRAVHRVKSLRMALGRRKFEKWVSISQPQVVGTTWSEPLAALLDKKSSGGGCKRRECPEWAARLEICIGEKNEGVRVEDGTVKN
jgi:hypothetical protein